MSSKPQRPAKIKPGTREYRQYLARLAARKRIGEKVVQKLMLDLKNSGYPAPQELAAHKLLQSMGLLIWSGGREGAWVAPEDHPDIDANLDTPLTEMVNSLSDTERNRLLELLSAARK